MSAEVQRPPRSNDDPGLDQVAQHLLDEERVAVGVLVHGADERRRRRVAGVRGDQRADVALVEPVERDPLDEAVAAQVGEQLGQRVRGPHLGVAVGADDQQRRVARRAGDVAQQVQRAAVGPVQVVEHERERRPRRDLVEQRRDRLEQQVAPQLGVAGRGRRLRRAARGSAARARPRRASAATRAQSSPAPRSASTNGW